MLIDETNFFYQFITLNQSRRFRLEVDENFEEVDLLDYFLDYLCQYIKDSTITENILNINYMFITIYNSANNWEFLLMKIRKKLTYFSILKKIRIKSNQD